MSTTLSSSNIEKKTIGKVFDHEVFKREGYFIVKGLFDLNEIEEIKSFHALFKEQVENRDKGSNVVQLSHGHIQCEVLNDGSVDIRKIHNDVLEYPRLLELYTPPKLRSIVREIIGERSFFHHSKYMCKPAGGGVRKPWHQDLAYWTEKNNPDARLVTVWTALDRATKDNGCIQVIPQSHKGKLLPHYHGEDFMVDESQLEMERVVFAEMNPGDSLFFDVKTLHASAKNDSKIPRKSIIVDFSNIPASESDKHPAFSENFSIY